MTEALDQRAPLSFTELDTLAPLGVLKVSYSRRMGIHPATACQASASIVDKELETFAAALLEHESKTTDKEWFVLFVTSTRRQHEL